MRIGKQKTLLDKAGEFADSALETLESALEVARDTATPLIDQAKENAKPILADGKAMAKQKAAAAAAATQEAAAAGREAAAAKLVEVKGEPEHKGGRLKKVLFVLGLAGVAAVVYKLVKGDQASDNWQSSYVPTPPPTTDTPIAAAAAATVTGAVDEALSGEAEADDAAGAGPDEAAADAAATPHEATTPDEPAEVVEVEADEAPKGKKKG